MDIFSKFGSLSIAVFGDYYMDEYLWIDAALNEPSLETGLVAYQCTKREFFPGAAGTITKNLANLGIGTIYAVGFTGDDGRGIEIRRALNDLGVNCDNLVTASDRCTPTHVKPWLIEDGVSRELSRIDIKNWTRPSPDLENAVLDKLRSLMGNIDALIIQDHAAEENYGIITDTIREALIQIADENPGCIIYADSRGRIGKFNNMMIKGNQFELCHAVYGQAKNTASGFDKGVSLASDPFVTRTDEEVAKACKTLFEKTGYPVVCTLGEHGLKIYEDTIIEIPGIHVPGQLDVCGAGDMFNSTFISALSAGADMETAGTLGNLAASMCVRQLGTTGHVTADDLMKEQDSIWNIEIIKHPTRKGFKYALFDFDGTVSLLREGWREIMIPYFVEVILKTDPSAGNDDITALVTDFVDKLTGKQTIFQCIRLDEEVRKRGGKAVDPYEYKAEYLRRLMVNIKNRHESILNKTAKPADFLVPGCAEFLALLKDNGVKLYLASGTDEVDVISEAVLLNVSEYFNGGIYGAKDDIKDCSKELVIRQILDDNNISGDELISFGDGYVEVQLIKDIGGYAIAVATNEKERKGVNPVKRKRLLEADADAVIPDFAEPKRLFDFIT